MSLWRALLLLIPLTLAANTALAKNDNDQGENEQGDRGGRPKLARALPRLIRRRSAARPSCWRAAPSSSGRASPSGDEPNGPDPGPPRPLQALDRRIGPAPRRGAGPGAG